MHNQALILLRPMSRIAICLIIVSGSGSVATAGGQPVSSHARITYTVKQPDETSLGPSTLLANINGKSHVVINKSQGRCLSLVDQRDFDGDGLMDALVEEFPGCGGNCCPSSFFFVSARPGGAFAVSPDFADSWKDPIIEKWKDRWSVVFVSNNEGMNLMRPVEFTRRFVFRGGKPLKVEEHRRQELKAIVEMRSEIFKNDLNDPDESHFFQYDLHGHGGGKKDTIRGTLWQRWGRIMWTVEFADGKTFSSDDACKRIGVLPTKTSGVHDLVCDQDTVLHWTGSAYK
jgi:hypothetical protein